MSLINEKSHASTTINSLDKIYKEAKMTGQLRPEQIVYLNIIYKFLKGCFVTLSNKQYNCLLSLYNKILVNSKYICPSVPYKKYTLIGKPKFTQADNGDCNNYPVFNKVYYWQESDYNTTAADVSEFVIITGFLLNKLSDTYPIFETGKDITYSNIGRICFLAMNSETTNYEIKDIMGNNITSQFDISLISSLKATLFVSKNIYSHGMINFKIKKL